VVLTLVPNVIREEIAAVIRGTVLRPVLALQQGAVERNVLFDDPVRLRAERDSLAAFLVGQAALATENRHLRELLSLRDRLVPSFVPAEVVRIPRATEGYFQLTAGTEQGVVPGASIVAAQGLVGRVLEVDGRISFGIDWMHHEFRASAMTIDGEVYGIAVPRRIEGEPMLVLTGAPRHVELATDAVIVTSGHGGVFPRGIPIGTVAGLENTGEDWQRNYVIRPAVSPTEMAYVLVLGEPQGVVDGQDLATYWGIRPVDPPAAPETQAAPAGPPPARPAAQAAPQPTAPPQQESSQLPGVPVQAPQD
jgi:rod shape-determining protein MreC